MSLNKVLLIGNLGKDPEVRYLENNKVVASFTLATNETFKDKNGQPRTDTEWHNIEMWDQLAKTAEKYLKKGSQVFIEGKIKTEVWKDKDGNERTGKKIRANVMTMLGSRNQSESGGNSYQSSENSNSSETSNTNGLNHENSAPPSSEGDDLPF